MIKSPRKLLPIGIAVSVLVAVASVLPALGQEQFERHHMINLVESHNMLAQRIGKEMILVALNIDKANNLRNLETSRALFERTLEGLRNGDSELGTSGSRNPEFLDGLSKVAELWLLFDATIRKSAKTRSVTADQVGTIADLTRPMSEAVQAAVNTLQDEARQKQLISMLDTTIKLLARQAALTQQMSKEFMLIAYGHEVDKNRRALKKSIAQFDRTLAGLLNGDAELQLVPAPNPDIKAQLRIVARLWDDFRPVLSLGTRGTGVDSDSLRKVAQENGSLFDALSETMALYETL